MRDRYEVIVIGGGHAGTEAAWAAASVLGAGGRVALVTMDPSRIGQMSCNPAIGGLAKGQIVREIDAMGGMMGLAADAAGILFKVLNTSKGAAVHGPRCQADKYAYPAEVQRLISTRANIDVIAGTADEIIVEDGQVTGLRLGIGAGIVAPDPEAVQWNVAADTKARPVYSSQPLAASRSSSSCFLHSSAIVLTTGTFMRGLLHTGQRKVKGGRMGEGSAETISDNLRRLGFDLGRLKTGTPPRLDRSTIDWNGLPHQTGDDVPVPFSDLSPSHLPAGRFPHLAQGECRITNTTAEGHERIRANLHRAPMYSGQIEADCGPRYCPSIEDKVVRFADRDSHHVFLEPESLHTKEIYCNGIATSLPADVQEDVVRAMPGCADATILHYGYAVEYDMVWPHQIDSTCQTKLVRGLFLAGQINGTSGYEEAGGQGLIAGLNAARATGGDEPIRLRRDEAFIGVMLDDLVTKTPREPYRMFTSRAEHRLLLRADNADLRLTPMARELGLVSDGRWAAFRGRQDELDAIRAMFDSRFVDGKSLWEIARRPEESVEAMERHLNGSFDSRLVSRVMTESKYEGYIVRQQATIKRMAEAERRRIPEWLDPRIVPGLRAEAAEVLAKFRPATMAQAGRLAGVSPADLTLLAVAIKRGPQSAGPRSEEG